MHLYAIVLHSVTHTILGDNNFVFVPFLRVPIGFAQFSKKKIPASKEKTTHHPRRVNAFLLSTLSLKGSLLSNGDADVQVSGRLVGPDPLVDPFLKVAQKHLDISVNHCTTHQKSVLT